MIDRDLYDNIINEHLQYPDNLDDSLLWKAIKQVQGCSKDEAIDRAHVHVIHFLYAYRREDLLSSIIQRIENY